MPPISARTPNPWISRRSASVRASAIVDRPAAHAPTPTTALVTRLAMSSARATSGWVRITRAVAASGTIIGA
jgi:hypothetical protein